MGVKNYYSALEILNKSLEKYKERKKLNIFSLNIDK